MRAVGTWEGKMRLWWKRGLEGGRQGDLANFSISLQFELLRGVSLPT